MFLPHGAPLEQTRLLERHPVVLVESRLARRLAVDEHGAGRRFDQVRDQPEQRRLAAARRPDQRHELAGLDDRGRCRGARRPRSTVPRLNTIDVRSTTTAADADGISIGAHPTASCGRLRITTASIERRRDRTSRGRARRRRTPRCTPAPARSWPSARTSAPPCRCRRDPGRDLRHDHADHRSGRSQLQAGHDRRDAAGNRSFTSVVLQPAA